MSARVCVCVVVRQSARVRVSQCDCAVCVCVRCACVCWAAGVGRAEASNGRAGGRTTQARQANGSRQVDLDGRETEAWRGVVELRCGGGGRGPSAWPLHPRALLLSVSSGTASTEGQQSRDRHLRPRNGRNDPEPTRLQGFNSSMLHPQHSAIIVLPNGRSLQRKESMASIPEKNAVR